MERSQIYSLDNFLISQVSFILVDFCGVRSEDVHQFPRGCGEEFDNLLALIGVDINPVAVDTDAGGDFVIKALPRQGFTEFCFDGILVPIEKVKDALVPVLVSGVNVDFCTAVVEIDNHVAIKTIGAFDGTTDPVIGSGCIDSEQAVY